MKKLITIALLLPFLASAASVGITDISPYTGGFSATGGASLGDWLSGSLSVVLDGGNSLWGGGMGSWNVTSFATAGLHVLTATVSGIDSEENPASVGVSQEFRVPAGGGMSPCQTDGTCPDFGIFAPTIPDQNAVVETLGAVSECPAWFPMGCRQ